MPKLKLDVNALTVVSYATAAERRDGVEMQHNAGAVGFTQTTICSYCTPVDEI